jgi:hypothetical protein
MADANRAANRMRQQFETYILRERGDSYLQRNDPGVDPEHDYADLFVQEAWEAWQASAASYEDAARAALSTLRDLQYGWPSRELHEPIEVTIDRLAGVVGEETVSVLESSSAMKSL